MKSLRLLHYLMVLLFTFLSSHSSAESDWESAEVGCVEQAQNLDLSDQEFERTVEECVQQYYQQNSNDHSDSEYSDSEYSDSEYDQVEEAQESYDTSESYDAGDGYDAGGTDSEMFENQY